MANTKETNAGAKAPEAELKIRSTHPEAAAIDPTGGGKPAETGDAQLEQLGINTVRVLSVDAVQKANSGHPGTPMGLAPMGHVLWAKNMRYNPRNTQWPNRDRFILSAGHACMLQYSFLYLTGYALTLDD